MVTSCSARARPRILNSPSPPSRLVITLCTRIRGSRCRSAALAKAADLQRDPRILVHSVITSRDGGEGEFKIRGRALAEHDVTIQRRYAAAVAAALGRAPEPGRFHLFAVDIEQVN